MFARKLVLLIFICCLMTNSAAMDLKQSLAPHSSSHRRIIQGLKDTIYKSKIITRRLGIIVATDNKVIYQLNGDQSFIPASLAKIFTAGTLLDLLSPSLRFQTQFLAKNFPKNGVLNGNLYLKGGGDPSFVSESLWNLVNHLTRTGLKKVVGDLVLDDHLFDRHHKSQRLSHSSHDSYDAPVGALSFNWSTANIYVRPGNKVGDALRVVIDPSDLYFSAVKNQTETLAAGKRQNTTVGIGQQACGKIRRIRQNKNISRRNPAKTVICIRGGLPLNSSELLLYRSISYPTLWTGWNAFSFLKQRQIVIEGNIRRGVVPSKAVELAKWSSRPLNENIRAMMKYSNNFMVEMLVKNLAIYGVNIKKVKVNSTICSSISAQKLGTHHLQSSDMGAIKSPPMGARRRYPLWGRGAVTPPLGKGTLKGGLRFIQQHIQQCLKISKNKYRLVQPSGLSRLNRFKPRHFIKALKYWLNHPLQSEFESALPLAGHDGTLKGRLLTVPARVHAKTGHLNGVVGLAGYAHAMGGTKYLFVFMFNGHDRQSAKAEKLFEQLAQVILKF